LQKSREKIFPGISPEVFPQNLLVPFRFIDFGPKNQQIFSFRRAILSIARLGGEGASVFKTKIIKTAKIKCLVPFFPQKMGSIKMS